MKKIVFLLALFSAFTHANDDISGFYLGGGFGTTNYDDGGAFDNTSIYTNEDDSTLKLIGGYQFNRIVAVEMQYTNYGDVTLSHVNSTQKIAVEPSSISLAANLGYTFDSGWRPFAIVGLGSTEFETKVQGLSVSDSKTSFHFGAGAEFAPKALEGLAFRVAYEGDVFVEEGINNYGYNEDYAMTVGTFYAGATYKF